ncbi:MAG: hypothetical protein KIT82_02355 [Bradyrhizobium sp.]|nr:hypothetical protein [Bradyrhizobium sp.]
MLLDLRPREGAATAARQMGEHKTDAAGRGHPLRVLAGVVKDFLKIAEGFVCPVPMGRDHESQRSHVRHGDELHNNDEGMHPEYKTVPYQTAQASAAIWRLEDQSAGSLSIRRRFSQALIKTDLLTFSHVAFDEDGSNWQDDRHAPDPGRQIRRGGAACGGRRTGRLSARRELLSGAGLPTARRWIPRPKQAYAR